ncbi:folate-binding protein YgfZ [Brooklawnia cerclae]|uniref:CAF17 C-terminal domain-containing protein n=1 Tax=Brooklawnia cerclae TaxID=349934 RepID=A0ABX0SBB5_9ACTN|nr:folate-binding protein YgfZ [Brooklawnia cerclae]NIH55614.1 hypothetical protein [Brooklawnia cerclae]
MSGDGAYENGRVEVADGPDRGMAWHFGDPLGEQRAMEAGEALVELTSREVFTVTGEERLSWLHSLTSQAIDGPQAALGVDALVLSPTGQIEHGFVLVDDGTTAWCWTEPGDREGLVAFLESMKFWTKAEVVARDDLHVVWVGEQVDEPTVVLAGRTSLVGAGRELVVPADGELPVARHTGQWAFEALRVAAGVPRIGSDTDARTVPNEIGLFGTALDKGCYRGQETVARVHNLGRPPRRFVRLLLDGALPEEGAAIVLDGREVGHVGTAAQHHELGPVALGLVKRSVPADATLVAGGIAASQEVLVDPEVGLHFRPPAR